MRDLIDQLCSPACVGRAPGTPGGARARTIVVDAFRAAGLDPYEQRVEACGGANVLAKIPGALAPLAPEAAAAQHHVRRLRAACDRDGNLPDAQRDQLAALIAMRENRLQ